MNRARRFRTLSASLLFALAAVSTQVAAEDLVFDFHNESSYVVMEFYASPTDVENWEEDILGEGVLGSGESTEITIADGREQCEYDFRIVVEGDIVVERAAIDLCELGEYTLTD